MGPPSRLLMPSYAGFIFELSDFQGTRKHCEAENSMLQVSGPSLSAIYP